MAGVRSLLARVARLERSDAPAVSPFEREFGSLDGFAAHVRAEIASGALDPRDGPVVLMVVQRWSRDRVWDLWR